MQMEQEHGLHLKHHIPLRQAQHQLTATNVGIAGSKTTDASIQHTTQANTSIQKNKLGAGLSESTSP
jgi:hypothetical protein